MKTSITLHDKLSRLSFTQAVKLQGPQSSNLIKEGSNLASNLNIDVDKHVHFAEDIFKFVLRDGVVTLALASASHRLTTSCSICDKTSPEGCVHIAMALSLVLEEKLALGLSVLPPEGKPLERMTEEELVNFAISERRARIKEEKLKIKKSPDRGVWGDYQVLYPKSGRVYRVNVRGWERGQSFCECPDFKKNTLGLCKHTMTVMLQLMKDHPQPVRVRPFKLRDIEVYIHYSESAPKLRLQAPFDLDSGHIKLVKPFLNRDIEDVENLIKLAATLTRRGVEPVFFPDAQEFIEVALFQNHMKTLTDEIRRDPASHPLRNKLLNVELLPYQLDGIAFAASRGRAILADDMGLGKTIQGVGLAELLAREAGITKVLVVCPASLKFQWLDEIKRFSNRTAFLIQGSAKERPGQYQGDQFFTVCNYEQVLRDHRYIYEANWDLLILDEAQRVKNWEASTYRAVAFIKSKFALVLTGTPLENRLEELFTIVSLVEAWRLGPAFRFLNVHKKTDDKGRLLGYRNLGEMKKKLAPILLRRTRAQVLGELPPRRTEVIRVAPTMPQSELHDSHLRVVTAIVNKPYFTEMDFLRLQKALLMCRLVTNFKEDENCSVFLTTNAGSTGLNLQVADTVVNLDLPWNPAILEQRISRVHRMGQTRPVQVFLLVTTETIEERLLALLGAKSALALASLDLESDVDELNMSTGIDELKKRLEILLGQVPDKEILPPKDELVERKRIASQAGGAFLSAAFDLISGMLPKGPEKDEGALIEQVNLLKKSLGNCIETDENGQSRLTVTMPDESSLNRLVESLARLMPA